MSLLSSALLIACTVPVNEGDAIDDPNGSTGGLFSAGGGVGFETGGGTGETGGTTATGGGTFTSGGSTGAGGNTNGNQCMGSPWMSGTNYVPGDVVSYDGNWYICTSENPGYDPIISEWFWDPYECGDAGSGGSGGSDGSGGGTSVDGCVLDKYLPGKKADWNSIFAAPWQNPQQHAVFSDGYNKLCEALTNPKLSGFASSGTDEQNKREIAAFLANVAIETAYLQDSAQYGDYASAAYEIGRGAIQLTYSYNYQAAADGLGDPSIYSNPKSVATDPLIVWETAVWFWMLKPNESVDSPNVCHTAILGGDFGRTLRIIKGDCGSHADRVSVYTKAAGILGVSLGDTSCP